MAESVEAVLARLRRRFPGQPCCSEISEGRCYCENGEGRADVERVAESHEKLLVALEELLPLADDEVSYAYDDVMDLAREAIANARGQA